MKPIINNDLVARLVLLAELIVIGIFTILTYLFFPEGGIGRTILFNTFAIAVLYRIVRALQKRTLRKNLQNISKSVHMISEDINAKINAEELGSQLQEFYVEIEKFRTKFADKEKNQQEMLKIINSIATNTELAKMLEEIMPQIAESTGSSCGVFYLVNHVSSKLEIKHSIGFSKNLYEQFDLNLGEGVFGISESTRSIKVVSDIPDDTVYLMRSFLGKSKPRSIMAVPAVNQDKLLGVLLLATVKEYSPEQIALMELVKFYLGVAVNNGLTYEKSKRIASEMKFQNKLIQDLNNDLENKVMERTTFLNDTLDSIKDYAIYAMDKEGTVLVWNKGAENILGYFYDEVIGQNIEMIYADDQNRKEKVKFRLESAMREGRYMESGWRIKRDGSSYFAEMSIFTRYDLLGEVIGFTNVTRDITAYKRVESALWLEKELSSKLFENSQRGLILLDSDGTIVMLNEHARDLLKSKDGMGYSIYNYFKNEKTLRESISNVLESGRASEIQANLRQDDSVLTLDTTIFEDGSGLTKKIFIDIS